MIHVVVVVDGPLVGWDARRGRRERLGVVVILTTHHLISTVTVVDVKTVPERDQLGTETL